jgi:hypothetical protein
MASCRFRIGRIKSTGTRPDHDLRTAPGEAWAGGYFLVTL